MKAVQVFGHAQGQRSLVLTDVAEPHPGDGEVLIQVHAVSASRLDLVGLRAVALGRPAPLPHTVGGDPAGVIVAVGDHVDPARVGQRVVVKPNLFCGHCVACTSGRQADCLDQPVLGVHRDGGAAELVAVPDRSAFRVPEEIGLDAAAAAVHTVPVALHMVRVAGGVRAGSPVVVTGAAGAVGSAAVQVVAASGGCPVAVVENNDQEAWVRQLDPADIIVLERESMAEGLARCAPAGLSMAVDTTGVADVFSAVVDGLAWGGHAVTVAGRPEPRASIDMAALYQLRRTVHGSAASDVADVLDGLALVRDGAVTPRVGLTLPLHHYRAAYAALDDPVRAGKVLMQVHG